MAKNSLTEMLRWLLAMDSAVAYRVLRRFSEGISTAASGASAGAAAWTGFTAGRPADFRVVFFAAFFAFPGAALRAALEVLAVLDVLREGDAAFPVDLEERDEVVFAMLRVFPAFAAFFFAIPGAFHRRNATDDLRPAVLRILYP